MVSANHDKLHAHRVQCTLCIAQWGLQLPKLQYCVWHENRIVSWHQRWIFRSCRWTATPRWILQITLLTTNCTTAHTPCFPATAKFNDKDKWMHVECRMQWWRGVARFLFKMHIMHQGSLLKTSGQILDSVTKGGLNIGGSNLEFDPKFDTWDHLDQS